jgi:hypothetical protein
MVWNAIRPICKCGALIRMSETEKMYLAHKIHLQRENKDQCLLVSSMSHEVLNETQRNIRKHVQ